MQKIIICLLLGFAILLTVILLLDVDTIGGGKIEAKVTAQPIGYISKTKKPAPTPTEVPKELYPDLSFDTKSIALGANAKIQGRAIKFLNNNTLLIEADGGYACITYLFTDYGLSSVKKDALYSFYGTQWVPTETKDNDGFQQKYPTLLLKYEVKKAN